MFLYNLSILESDKVKCPDCSQAVLQFCFKRQVFDPNLTGSKIGYRTCETLGGQVERQYHKQKWDILQVVFYLSSSFSNSNVNAILSD
jgi:hypothetical protein